MNTRKRFSRPTPRPRLLPYKGDATKPAAPAPKSLAEALGPAPADLIALVRKAVSL
ncbi:MAG: hypothetical protein DIU78_013125 [Pseudomonadota bacterium]